MIPDLPTVVWVGIVFAVFDLIIWLVLLLGPEGRDQ